MGVVGGGAGSGAEGLGWPDLTRGRVYKRAGQGLAALAGAAAIALAATPAAEAACEKTYSYEPKKDANYGKPPLIIGDSTMVYAAPLLANRGFISNARECRFWDEGLDILRNYKQRNDFGKVAVMALGSNDILEPGDIDDALDVVGKKRILGLVTPREAGGRLGNAKVMRAEARDHPSRIRLIDWVHHSDPHPGWFGPDGIHVTAEGAAEQARYYAQRVFKILRPPKKSPDKR